MRGITLLTKVHGTLWRVDTPAGYIASGRMHYYIRDHQGNVRQVTDPTGMQLQLSGNLSDVESTIALYERITGGALKLSVDDKGMVKIESRIEQNMNITSSQIICANTLSKIIKDEKTVTLNIVNNSEDVVIGDIETARVDIGDIMALGDDKHVTSGTTIMHETYEQYYIQTHPLPSGKKERNEFYAKAHCNDIGVEKVIMNSNFNTDKLLGNCIFGNREVIDIGFGVSLVVVENIESLTDESCFSTVIIFKNRNVVDAIDIEHKE